MLLSVLEKKPVKGCFPLFSSIGKQTYIIVMYARNGETLLYNNRMKTLFSQSSGTTDNVREEETDVTC